MVEILAKNIENLFENTANRIYQGTKYDVYAIPDSVHKNMCDMSDEEFEQKCPDGWWRSAEGSTFGSPDTTVIINGKEILAWCGEYRKNYYTDCCSDCGDFQTLCKATTEDIEMCLGTKKYDTLLNYLCQELGVSSAKNVCAVCVDLAKYNNMTMAELFSVYQGEEMA